MLTEKNHCSERNNSLRAVIAEGDKDKRSILWREWLDSFYLADTPVQERMLREEPPMEGGVWDALLAAAAAWLAHKAGITAPLWCRRKDRRFDGCYWGEGGHSVAANRLNFLMTPPEFLARNLFIGMSFLERARMPEEWRGNLPLWYRELGEKLMESHRARRKQKEKPLEDARANPLRTA